MKSSKLTPYDRRARREKIMEKRESTRKQHMERGRFYVQSKTTRFHKTVSDRQKARYARQTGYVAPVVPATPIKPKRIRKTGASA
jgi:hypothetical protein